jgi:hypothetical protein
LPPPAPIEEEESDGEAEEYEEEETQQEQLVGIADSVSDVAEQLVDSIARPEPEKEHDEHTAPDQVADAKERGDVAEERRLWGEERRLSGEEDAGELIDAATQARFFTGEGAEVP